MLVITPTVIYGFSVSMKCMLHYFCSEFLMQSLLLIRLITVFSLWMLFLGSTQAQNKFSVSGTVTDEATGETILGANVVVKELGRGVSTNLYGFYSISLPAGVYTFVFSFIGYTSIEKTVELDRDQAINIELGSQVIATDVVEIVGEKNANTESTDMGRIGLEVETIKSLPALLGEVDILKTLQFLPGVQSAGEGNSGFYVRGGGPDQNLILLDNATIYNAAHLFGFFSVFNADAVKNIDLIKGGMPASFGGRISSVLDISLKEGNNKKHTFEGGIGLISSRLTAQGPLKKGVSSYIISARRTYIDVLARPFVNPESAFAGSGYYFYDLNAKVNYTLSDRDRIFLSGYFGRDVFGFNSATVGFGAEIPWGNAMGSLRWNHIFSDQLFMNVNATYSKYEFAFIGNQDDFEFSLNSGIEDWSGKVQFSWYPDLRHEVKAGVDYVFHTFTPSQVSARSGETEFNLGGDMPTFSHEFGVYIQDEFDISPDFKVNAGIRYSGFAHIGPFTRFVRDDIQDAFAAVAGRETIEYGRGELVRYYGGLEPRLSMRYRINERSSVKGGYSKNYQYVHLASLSPTSLPTDVWLPSTDRVEPQSGVQYAVGYFRDIKGGDYEASVELYYKDMQNLVEYEEGARPEDNINNNTDNQLVFGSGYSYGAEFFFKKTKGSLNGWIGYTWSKNMRQFDDLNLGRPFPARFDRRHDLSIVANYKLNERWEFGAAFVYATGDAITLPVQRYFYEGRVVDVFDERNSFRMAPFHRADVSATLHPKKQRKNKGDAEDEPGREKRFNSFWTFSIYNVYNRMNPYFIYFGNSGDLSSGSLQIQAYQVSLFPILPSVTWNFRF